MLPATLAVLLALVVSTLSGVFAPAFATDTTMNWDGVSGADKADPGCQPGQDVNWEWTLTASGGDVQLQTATLTTNYTPAHTTVADGTFVFGGTDTNTLHFYLGLAAPEAVQSASVSFNYTGTGGTFVLAIIDASCTGTPTDPTVIPVPTVPVVDPCGPNNAYYGTVPAGNYTVTRNPDRSMTLVANSGYVFPGSQATANFPVPTDSNATCAVYAPRGTIKVKHHRKAIFSNINTASNRAVWFTDTMKYNGHKVVKRVLVPAGGTTRVVMRVHRGAKVTIVAMGRVLAKTRC
jgi:hypothetical protein